MDEQSPHRVADTRRGIRRFVREQAASSHFPRRAESPRFVVLFGDDPRRRLTRSLVVGLVAWRPLVAIRFVPTMPRRNDRVALTSDFSRIPKDDPRHDGRSRNVLENRNSVIPSAGDTRNDAYRTTVHRVLNLNTPVDSLPLPLLSFPPYNSTLVPSSPSRPRLFLGGRLAGPRRANEL